MENEENILYAAFQYLLAQKEEYDLGMVRLLSPASYRVLQDWEHNILPRRFYPHH